MASSATHDDTKDTPREGGRLVTERDGQGGVSDARRAELSRLEAAAGLSHDAPDAAQRSRTDADNAASPINPDIDKQ